MAMVSAPPVARPVSVANAIFFVGWPERFNMAERYYDEVLVNDPELNDGDKLLLYSLRSQSNEGPCVGPRPSMWNKVEMAKWSTWRQLKNMSKPEAMNNYVRAVSALQPNWWKWSELGLYEEAPAADDDATTDAATVDASSVAGGEDGVAVQVSVAGEAAADEVTAGGEARASDTLAASPAPGQKSAGARGVGGMLTMAKGWHPLQTTGLTARAQYRHAAAVIGAQMFVFGGRTHSGRLPEGVRVLSLLTCEWTQPEVDGVVPARFAHTMSAWRHMLVVFGGLRKREYLGDVALLDTHNLCWLHAEPSALGAPVARAYHSSTLLHNRLYVFGGEDGGGLLPPTVHALDLLTLSWASPTATGAVPGGVRDHVAVGVGSRLLVVGGSGASGYVDGSRLHVLETEGMVWSQLRCAGNVPTARAGHAAALTPSLSDGGWDLCVFGGGDGARGFSDLYRLDLNSHAWAKVSSAEEAPSGLTPREGATCVSAGTLLVVYGGYTSTGCAADTFVSTQGMHAAPLASELLGAAGGGAQAGDAGGTLTLLASSDAAELCAAQEVCGRALQSAVLGAACSLGDGDWVPVGHDETYGAALQKLELLQLQLEQAPAASPARRAAYLASCHAGLLPVCAGGEERWFLFYWVAVQDTATRRRAAAMSAGVQLSAPLVAKARESRFTRSIDALARELRGGADALDVQEVLTNRLMTQHAQLTEAWYSAIGSLLAEDTANATMDAAEAAADAEPRVEGAQ